MLKIEHLKKTFSGKTILDDISLEVKSGEIVSIIGPSGTGRQRFCAVSISWKNRTVEPLPSMK